MTKISLGTDPEICILDSKGDLKSAIGIIKGTKEDRLDLGNGYRCYYDNVLAECEVKPAKSADEFVNNIGECLKRLTQHIKPYRVKLMASMTFPKEECRHEDAWRVACSPEFDAYDICAVQPPSLEKGNCFRSAGGHIHIGFDGGKDGNGDPESQFLITMNRIWVARMCDIFIGLPSLFLDKDPTSAKRRQLYGGAGTHRPCPYGVEYRTLSNFWLERQSLVHLMYRLAEFAVCMVDEKKNEHLWENVIDPEVLRSTINSGDRSSGLEYFNAKVRNLIPESLMTAIDEEAKKEIGDLYENWGL